MNMRPGAFLLNATIMLCACAPPLVADAPATAPATPNAATQAPSRLDPAALAGQGLTPVPPVPPAVLLSGTSQPRRTVLFKGDAFVIVVYEEQPVRLALKAPGMPYDEFIHILDGTLILTDKGGQSHAFNAGDFVVIPKGFTGTWETRSNFRELAFVTRSDWDATH